MVGQFCHPTPYSRLPRLVLVEGGEAGVDRGREKCPEACHKLALAFSIGADQGPFWKSLENSQVWAHLACSALYVGLCISL